MTIYRIEIRVPYERVQSVNYESLEEVVSCLRLHKSIYENCLDNVKIDNITTGGVTSEVDAYRLMKHAEAGKPLAVPGMLEVETEVFGLLSDVRREVIGQETLDRIDRLRDLIAGLVSRPSTDEMASLG